MCPVSEQIARRRQQSENDETVVSMWTVCLMMVYEPADMSPNQSAAAASDAVCHLWCQADASSSAATPSPAAEHKSLLTPRLRF